MQKFREIRESVLQLLYPEQAVCVGCGDLSGIGGRWLCEDCARALEALSMQDRRICPRCGVETDGACTHCADWPADAVAAVRYCYGYAHPVDAAVMEMKYSGVYRMTGWMAERMLGLLEGGAFGRVDRLVPVPMHPARLRERGRNHALSLAQELSRLSGVPVFTGLARVRNTKQQARQKGEARRKGMEGAFALRSGAEQIIGKRLLLIDDVVTTGTTVNSCAKVLYANGAACVSAAAFAGHLSANKIQIEK
ncbi:MAG: ComF family protein [Eubacteriales bacterium]|nr:ComF family protein [Eubacteriales bacterium]